MSTETLTIRIDSETKQKLDRLAQQTSRTKSFLAAEAITEFVNMQSWQIGQVLIGIADCDSGRVVPHEQVEQWMKRWGKKKELPPPR
ncbi:MAG: ribbon-helix-helix protein, CopG family [Acidobacteria bacterium]|nr:ribbon-helix-helix protein, CopG family [Acidobacteriota bacterium]